MPLIGHCFFRACAFLITKTSKGKLLSMPFNSSTPVMYYNKELLAKAGIKRAPKTWEELIEFSKKAIAKGAQCGLTVGWQSWVLLENFSSIHDVPFASEGNGFDSLNTNLKVNNKKVNKLIGTLRNGIKEKTFSYEGRRSDPARNAFVGQKCIFQMDSSSSYSSIKKLAKFKFGVAPLPHFSDTKPKKFNHWRSKLYGSFEGIKMKNIKA